MGQWLSEDPIGFKAGDENLRRAVGNGVTGASDPSGLVKIIVWKNFFKKLAVTIEKHAAGGASYILENGQKIGIKNFKWASKKVNYKMLECQTDVHPDTIVRLKKYIKERWGVKEKDFHIRYDAAAQPNFTRFREFVATNIDPSAKNYAELAKKQLEDAAENSWFKSTRDKYAKLLKNQQDYVWHHKANGELELLHKDLHTSFQHTGIHSIATSLEPTGHWADIMTGTATTIALMVPGYAEASQGDINGAGREVVWNLVPGSSFVDLGVMAQCETYDAAVSGIADAAQSYNGSDGWINQHGVQEGKWADTTEEDEMTLVDSIFNLFGY